VDVVGSSVSWRVGFLVGLPEGDGVGSMVGSQMSRLMQFSTLPNLTMQHCSRVSYTATLSARSPTSSSLVQPFHT